MKKNTLRKFLSLALALIMVLGLAACGGDKGTDTPKEDTTKEDTTKEEEKSDVVTSENNAADEEVVDSGNYKKELTIGCDEAFYSMDPGYSTGINQLTVHNLAHDCLVTADLETGEIVGELAESWEWLDDVTIRWHLRQGVKFHNGQDLKANDVAFSIDHVKKSVCAICYVWIDDTTIVDDYTINLNLNDPAQDLIQEFAVSCFRILDEETCYEDPDEGVAVGTGPFILES